MPPGIRLNDTASIRCSGETGLIIGRATFTNKESQSLLRYRAADGRAQEAWWDDSALELAPSHEAEPDAADEGPFAAEAMISELSRGAKRGLRLDVMLLG